MNAMEKKKPKRAWRQGLGSKAGKIKSPDANSIGLKEETQAMDLSAMDCLRFSFCNCPVCPFDSNWQHQRHLSGEPVCIWLREAVKSSCEPILKRALPDELVEQVVSVAKILLSRKGALKSSLDRAALKPSKSRTIAPWQRTGNGKVT